MRYARQRDANDLEIYRALEVCGADPERGTDCDIYARDIHGAGHLLEVKVPGKEKRLRPIQVRLRAIFGDRYHIVTSAESALRALGRVL